MTPYPSLPLERPRRPRITGRSIAKAGAVTVALFVVSVVLLCVGYGAMAWAVTQ